MKRRPKPPTTAELADSTRDLIGEARDLAHQWAVLLDAIEEDIVNGGADDSH